MPQGQRRADRYVQSLLTLLLAFHYGILWKFATIREPWPLGGPGWGCYNFLRRGVPTPARGVGRRES